MQEVVLVSSLIALAATIIVAPQVIWLAIILISCLTKKKERPAPPEHFSKEYNFKILVPAHNEEAVIGPCIESLKSIRYRNVTITIIADNCSDRTAQIARYHGVDVWERQSDSRKSKG